MVVNSSSQSRRQQRPSIAELNLATLTLPQLNNLADSFSNASGSAMASPRQETGQMCQLNNQNEFQQQQLQFIAKSNYNSAKAQVTYFHFRKKQLSCSRKIKYSIEIHFIEIGIFFLTRV